MDKAYSPEVHDQKWQKFWDSHNFANPDISHALHPHPKEETFVIAMPPPNVTGVLHTGHALMLTLEDTLVRWERMRGKKALYIPGTDHASIAVQMQVVKHLAAQKINYRDLGREQFLKEAWKWIEEYRPRIYSQIRAMGVSCDWSRIKFTLDDDLNKAVNRAFVTFYKSGHIYHAQKLVNWCPKSQTVLSDLEVIFEEQDGKLWHIKYALKEDPSSGITVATTRPETLLGDVAVAVHPEDERYKKLIGKKLVLPFTGREIPIIADDFVERTFGSGAVKITPAHDFADFDVGQRHKLELINIFTPDAKIIAGLPGEAAKFAGLDRFEARKKMVAELAANGQLVKEEAYKNRVGMSERANVPVEPYLSYQWFCKMDSMAKSVVDDLAKDEFRFVPHEFHNQFLRWMENIRDWCISRQLWWGHAIPAYHCTQCKHIEVSEVALKTCVKCSAPVTPDPDVLDTWFSSGLWPFSILGWPENTKDFKDFYPTQVLETGFDILFFWVARMLLMGKELTGKLPFKNIYMHPMVRDEQGQKMSKTKGNTIDPLEIVQSVGADSLRMTMNALCVQGRDMRLSIERIEGYRNFLNKIWNATKFVLMDESVKDVFPLQARDLPNDLASDWILGRFNDCAFKMNRSWEDFRMQEAADHLYHFFWNDFCDWFLEISKTNRSHYQPVLLHVLSESLKLLHPLCPHISEELWHELPGVKPTDSLAICAFPIGEKAQEKASMTYLKDFIGKVRVLRNESKVPLSKVISIFANVPESEKKYFEPNLAWAESLSKTKIVFGSDQMSSNEPHSVLTVGSSDFKIKLSELVNKAEEIERLKKELANLNQYVKSMKSKLSNDAFTSKAPEQVVKVEKAKLQDAEEKIKKMSENLSQLESL